MRYRVFLFIPALILLTIFFLPVCANPIELTLVNYSIYQNNQPIDDSINLSVNCYGLYNEYRLKAMGRQKKTSDTANTELVYSYSLSCDPGYCYRQDTYDTTWGMFISSCDLDGKYKGKPFVVKNFTTKPGPNCISTAYLSYPGYGGEEFYHHYAIRSEDSIVCNTKYFDDMRDFCDKYLQPDQPDIKEGHIHVSRNKKKYIPTEKFLQCSQRIFAEQRMCYEIHSLVNLTLLENYHAQHYCEQRFDIPSDNNTNPISCLTGNTYVPRSPVESLYCSLLHLFGGTCE